MGRGTATTCEVSESSTRDLTLEFALKSVRAGLYALDGVHLQTSIASDSLDWRAIIDLLFANRLATLAARRFKAEAALMPGWVSREFEYFNAVTTRKNSANLLTMRRIVPRLGDAGVDMVAFKGPPLQLLAHGSLFIRPSADFDLLVPTRDFDKTTAVLTASGYRLAASCRSIWWRLFLGEQHYRHDDDDSVTVDVHHRVQQPGCPFPKRPEAFFEQRQWVTIGGTPIPTLSDRHALLLAAMSLVKALHHREPAGRYAADLAAMILKIDVDAWRLVQHEAAQQGLSNTLRLGQRAVRVLLAIEAPGGAGREVLTRVPDTDLADMLVRPKLTRLKWPSRRTLLWELCDRKRDYPRNLLLMFASELVRNTFEPDLPSPVRPASEKRPDARLTRPVEEAVV